MGAWAVFAAVVVVAIAIDVGVLHRRPGRISLKAAVAESAGWVTLALGFGLWVYLTHGRQAGLRIFCPGT